ncbi:phage holin family protein [Microlunatus parietis]|uniref:Uncharacterized membrane protein YvlD (DUF360 family) n=1 Tax=Microlunatus parietis TaxID=682979 RepID=A0A7Y9IF55_9ACTN|nr:phage holin family protein [Microlunatus parietis]NYE75640.1 uncharacterized membrane protein YvlD (DUF360 family) [Microlunatus parietis]
MAGRAAAVLILVPVAALAAWLADDLVPGYRTGEGPLLRGLGFMITGVVFAIMIGFITWLAGRALRPLERHAARLLRDEDDTAFGAETDWEFFRPIRVLWLLSGLRYALELVITFVVAPLAFWLGTTAARTVGLPVQLDGFWPTVLAALIVEAVRKALPQRRPAPRRIALWLVRLLLPAVGIALAVLIVPGFDLAPGPWFRQALAVLVLGLLSQLITLWVQVPFVTVLLRVAGNAVKLWAVSWLSGWSNLPLHVDGFWPLVLAAMIFSVATWFLQFPRPKQQPQPPQLDPFWPHDPLRDLTTPRY